MLTTTVSHQILEPLKSNIESTHSLISSEKLPPELRQTVLRLLISSKLVAHFANDLVDNNALESSVFVPIHKFAQLTAIF